jgi:hypothetical protein
VKSILIWLAVFYGAFKFPAMALALNRGFVRRDLSFGDRLRAGEPGVFLAAVLISVPLVLLMSGYSKRTYTGNYLRAVACQGRITALMDLPEIRRSADGFAVYETVQGYGTSAYVNAAHLGMKPDQVTKALAESRRSFSEAYGALRSQRLQQGMKDEVSRTLRCLHPPPDPPNL